MHRRFTVPAVSAAILLAFNGSTLAQGGRPFNDFDIPIRRAEAVSPTPAPVRRLPPGTVSRPDSVPKNNPAPGSGSKTISRPKKDFSPQTKATRRNSGTRSVGITPGPAVPLRQSDIVTPPVTPEPVKEAAVPTPPAVVPPVVKPPEAAFATPPPVPLVVSQVPAAAVPEVPAASPALATVIAPDVVGYPPGVNAGTITDLQWPVPDAAALVTPEEIVGNIAHNKISINVIWTLLAGFLVMFMQAGFALVETGLTRAKNAAHVMAVSFLIYPLGVLAFWFCGFAFMYGGYWNGPAAINWQPTLGQGLQFLNNELTLSIFGKTFGLIGLKGFCLDASVFDSSIFALFLFQLVFMVAASNIPPGALAERWNFKNFLLYGLWMGLLCYPIYGNWVWGGGWLAQLGKNFGLGHGHVDFAGSSVVHMTGGVAALVGAWLIGPRIGKYSINGNPRPIPGHNVTYVILGTFILAFGWFGFNPGSTLAGTDLHISVVAVNTMLASAAGAVATLIVFYWRVGTPDPTMVCNGMLAGLVAITGPCAFVNSICSVMIGAIAGVLVVFSVFFIEGTLKIDDPAGAISVHGVCGTFGVLCVGLFANGSYGAGWGGVHTMVKSGVVQTFVNDGTPATLQKFSDLQAAGWADQGVTGLFGPLFGAAYWDGKQFVAALIGVLANIVFVGIFSFAWFTFANRIFPMRSNRSDEINGLDVPELGVEAYPDFELNDRSSPPV